VLICDFLLRRFYVLFVKNDQLEVGPLSRQGDVAAPIHPITGRPSLSPASFARYLDSAPYGSACLIEARYRVYRVPHL
jgi:hypothetical protein